MLTPQERAEIRARADAATKGPWTLERDNCGLYACEPDIWRESRDYDDYGTHPNDSDAAFIAASRADIPRLLDDVDELEKEVERLQRYEPCTFDSSKVFPCSHRRDSSRHSCDCDTPHEPEYLCHPFEGGAK